MENKTEKKPFDLRAESKAYAIESIKLYQHLTEYAPKKEYNLSKHYLISATRSFSFAPNTTISTAGSKATNYRLRLVKTLRLKLQQ